jgi:restriction system protein
MLGQKSVYASICFAGGFMGADFEINEDLTKNLPDNWRVFNKKFIPIYLATHPDKTRIGAGLSCGALWTVAKGIQKGDIILSPDGSGAYKVGEVTSEYYYSPEKPLQHRRKVTWFNQTFNRSDMSDDLRHSAGSIGTISEVTKYQEEIERLIKGCAPPSLSSTDETVEDPSEFAMEEHLEDFLVQNWPQTALGREYDIFEEDGEPKGQQYMTDTGPMDILAVKKDKSEILVVELKKGRASDVVVGQTLRYMGYVHQELAEPGQAVKGVIIAFEDDQRIKRALAAAPNIEFYRYQVTFKLVKGVK